MKEQKHWEEQLEEWSEDPERGLCADFTTDGFEYYDQLKLFIETLLQEQKQETAIEVLEFLDHLEMVQPEDLKIDNWRNWKYIRNSIVDKYEIPTQQKVEL